MSIAHSLEISASGLSAERLRMDTISSNLANINTTRQADRTKGPYRRQFVIFAANEQPGGFAAALRGARAGGGGVRVVEIAEDQKEFKRVSDPGHPDAGPDGFVLLPNVEPVMEMVDLITATRAYEANITAMGASKQMQQKALEIGKG